MDTYRTCNTMRLAQSTCQRLAQFSLRRAQHAHAISSLAALVATKAELLDLNLRNGMCADGPRFRMLAEDAVQIILAQIRNLALSPPATVIDVMKHIIHTNFFNQEEQNRIRDAMNAKVNNKAPTHNAANCKYQSVMQPHTWLPDALHDMAWLPPRTQEDPVREQLHALARLFGRGGIKHGTEHAYRDIASTAMFSPGCSKHCRERARVVEGVEEIGEGFRGLEVAIVRTAKARFLIA